MLAVEWRKDMEGSLLSLRYSGVEILSESYRRLFLGIIHEHKRMMTSPYLSALAFGLVNRVLISLVSDDVAVTIIAAIDGPAA
jgi:hypothetical protein